MILDYFAILAYYWIYSYSAR